LLLDGKLEQAKRRNRYADEASRRLFKEHLEDLKNKNVRLNVIGQARPPPRVFNQRDPHRLNIQKIIRVFVVEFSLDYGARFEIPNAVKSIAKEQLRINLSISMISNEKIFSDHLYTKALPDPDLLIRTSGKSV